MLLNCYKLIFVVWIFIFSKILRDHDPFVARNFVPFVSVPEASIDDDTFQDAPEEECDRFIKYFAFSITLRYAQSLIIKFRRHSNLSLQSNLFIRVKIYSLISFLFPGA
jgi:hypothetical protein